jgi:hypothetical protein
MIRNAERLAPLPLTAKVACGMCSQGRVATWAIDGEPRCSGHAVSQVLWGEAEPAAVFVHLIAEAMTDRLWSFDGTMVQALHGYLDRVREVRSAKGLQGLAGPGQAGEAAGQADAADDHQEVVQEVGYPAIWIAAPKLQVLGLIWSQHQPDIIRMLVQDEQTGEREEILIEDTFSAWTYLQLRVAKGHVLAATLDGFHLHPPQLYPRQGP